MATTPKFSNLTANGEADFIGVAADSGYIRIYDGAQPADADTASEAFAATATWDQAAASWGAVADVASEAFSATGSWTQAAATWLAAAEQTLTATATFEQAAATWEAIATSAGGGVVARRFHWLEAALDAPVVNHTLMDALVERYGKDRARQVYFAQEREAQDSFGPNGKYNIAERPPQPVVMVASKSPPPGRGRSAAPPPPSDTELRLRTAEAVRKMGFGRRRG